MWIFPLMFGVMSSSAIHDVALLDTTLLDTSECSHMCKSLLHYLLQCHYLAAVSPVACYGHCVRTAVQASMGISHSIAPTIQAVEAAGKFSINTVHCNSVLRVACPRCFVCVCVCVL